MKKATVKIMKILSLVCCVAILATIMSIYQAKEEINKLTENIASIQLETLSSEEKLVVIKVEPYFDLENREYRLVRFKGSTVGLVKCVIPVREANEIVIDAVYEAQIDKLSVVGGTDSNSKMTEIKFMYTKYIDREQSGFGQESYDETALSIRRSYIDGLLEKSMEEISDMLTHILTAYIIIMIIGYSATVMFKQNEQNK